MQLILLVLPLLFGAILAEVRQRLPFVVLLLLSMIDFAASWNPDGRVAEMLLPAYVLLILANGAVLWERERPPHREQLGLLFLINIPLKVITFFLLQGRFVAILLSVQILLVLLAAALVYERARRSRLELLPAVLLLASLFRVVSPFLGPSSRPPGPGGGGGGGGGFLVDGAALPPSPAGVAPAAEGGSPLATALFVLGTPRWTAAPTTTYGRSPAPTASRTAATSTPTSPPEGSATAASSSTTSGQHVSLTQQIQQVKFALSLGEEAASDLISKSIVYVSIGSNDFIHYYLQNQSMVQSLYLPWEFNQLLATIVKQELLNLYAANVRKVVLMGLPPVGCTPHYLWQHRSQNGECVEEINNLIVEFNFALRYVVYELNQELPDANIVFCDAFKGSMDILTNRHLYGFETTTHACCGLGKYGGLIMCLMPEMACSNASTHVWWDEFHPTDAVNALLADNVWSGLHTDMCYPMNLQDMIDSKPGISNHGVKGFTST